MIKKKLFTPGPTSVPEEILLEMARPIMHHRTDEFQELSRGVFRDLKYVFQTENDVLLIASSGTGAMEAAVVNLLSPGDKAIVVSAGKFGERFREIAEAYEIEIITIEAEWGETVDASRVEETLRQNPGTAAVFATLCETSTGVSFDIKAMGKAVSAYKDTVFVVDTVSSLGAVPCMTDEWKIDVVVSGSQKALMLPPGLAMISVSEKAWSRIDAGRLPRYYLDLRKYRKASEKADFPFTMAVTLVCGLKKSLDIIKERTLEQVWEEHHARAEAARQAFISMGLKLFPQAVSDALTAISLPDSIDGNRLVKFLRTRYGISVAGGQGHLKGKIVRISHLGWQDEFDVITAIMAVSIGLREQSWVADAEKGIAAASAVLFNP